MRKLNYKKIMAHNPTEYMQITNHLRQEVTFYEHPIHGDLSPVLASIDEVMVDTEFFDTEDMFEGSDYLPCLVDGEIICAFEI